MPTLFLHGFTCICYCCCCLGVYGDVLRVKILYSKRDSALIQFREAQQAQNCKWVWLLYVM